jgi:hypothetical protein
MMMRFRHEDAGKFLFSGKCRFKVIEQIERNNPFDGSEEINLKLLITDSEGRTANFFNSLNALKPWHIRDFCLASGIPLEVFQSNNLTASECANKEGYCTMKVYKDKNGEDKSGISKWLPLEPSSNDSVPKMLEPNSVKTEDLNDDIPF